MTSKNSLVKENREFILTGKGKNEREAYEQIFSQFKVEIYKQVKGVLLQMEPEEVYVLSTDVKKYTEKFLFLFLPREKQEITVKVKLIVSIKYIEI